MPDLFSKRQLRTIASIQKAKLDLHCGPMGCGKTFSIMVGLGVACSATPPPRSDSCIALVGRTSSAVKSNMLNVLNSKFGNNFRYDTGKKDGYAKDATIFGHRIRIVGLNDSTAEDRIRGLNAYKIVGDEVTTWGEDNFQKIQGRLRGDSPEGWNVGFIGSTNPDSPKHWLKKTIDDSIELDRLFKEGQSRVKGDINYIKWSEQDNILEKMKEYYQNLRNRYRKNPAYLSRYVLGEWAAADGLVYQEFRDKDHVISQDLIKQLHFVSYKLGIDFGTTNPSAILLIGVTSDGEYVVVSEVYIREATITRVAQEIRNLVIEYHRKLTNIYIDPAAKALILQLESEGMLNIHGANNSVIDGIDHVKDLFAEDKLYISDSCTNLIDELYTYAYSDKDRTKVLKQNDHACDGLRYGLYS